MRLRVGLRLRRLPLQVALLHALVASAAPLLHHDLACHVKTPTHCDACVQTPMGPRAEVGFTLERPRLTDLGHVPGPLATGPAPEPVLKRSGRAPPA